jgi:aminoglycoside phosphotransferase (APT) family kinase protein
MGHSRLVLAREIEGIASALGRTVVEVRPLAGGFSHETCLMALNGGDRVVVRFGGPDPFIEAAVMSLAGAYVPVPRVLHVVPPARDGSRPAMVLEYVPGTLLSDVLSASVNGADTARLGAEVGRVIAGIGTVTFGCPGFFTDRELAVGEMPPWSQQLPEMAATCMDAVPPERLDLAARKAWIELCVANAPALGAISAQARLVHADANPKNILVTRAGTSWRVDAVLDWEFSFSGSPYADFGNMARFSGDYPARFTDGFRSGFAEHQPPGLPRARDWAYLGRVLDMFALSDLVTRPAGHAVADQAAGQIRRWISDGIPDAPG